MCEARVLRPALYTNEILLLSLRGSVFERDRRVHVSSLAESTYVRFTGGYRRRLDSVNKAFLVRHQARGRGETLGSRRLVTSPTDGGSVERAGRRQRRGSAKVGSVRKRRTANYVGEHGGGGSL